MSFLVTSLEGGNFRVSLADGGELFLETAPGLPGSGTVTQVTAVAPIGVSPGGAGAASYAVSFAGSADLTAAGLVQAISGPSPINASPAVFQWLQTTVGPTWTQAQQANGSAPQPMSFACQAPGAAASNPTNGTPGGFTFTLPAPVNGGSEGFFSVTRTGGLTASLGVFPGAPTVLSCLWLGPAVPSPTNFALANEPTNGALILNGISAPSGINTLAFFLDGATPVFLAGKDTTGGQGFDLGSGGGTTWAGGVGITGLPNATTEPTSNANKTHFWSFPNGAFKVRSSLGYKANLVAVGSGAQNTQATFVDTFSSVVRTVSSATPAAFGAYTTQTNTIGWINVRLKSKAATAGVGVAAGDGAFAEYRLGYKNVAGTVTLSTAGITLVGAVQTTAAALTATLTAAAAGATVVFSVSNVNLVTVDSQIDCTIDVC